jgi:hypothetical protein
MQRLNTLQEYEEIVKKVKNKIAFSKETVECLHLIFWSGSQRRVTAILQNWSRIGG